MAIANDMKVPFHDNGQKLPVVFVAELELGNTRAWPRAS